MGKKTNSNKHTKNKRDRLKFNGTVLEGFRSALFTVKLHTDTESEIIVKCTLCGKMKEKFIKVVPDDIVEVELCEYDMTKGRIVTRIRT